MLLTYNWVHDTPEHEGNAYRPRSVGGRRVAVVSGPSGLHFTLALGPLPVGALMLIAVEASEQEPQLDRVGKQAFFNALPQLKALGAARHHHMLPH